MRNKLLLLALLFGLVAAAPVGNGSAAPPVYAGQATNTTGTTAVNSSVAAGYTQCLALDTSSPAILVSCSVSGTTVTLTNTATFVQAGSCTAACAAQTFTIAYSAPPLCEVTDNSASGAAVGFTTTATAITPTGTAAHVLDWLCIGTASGSGHIFTIFAN